MASVPLGFTNSLILFKPSSATRKTRTFQYSKDVRNRFGVRGGLRDDNGAAVVEERERERERELVTQLNGSVNGRAQSNGSYSFDKASKDGENGTLVKYLNGGVNGVVEVEKEKEKKKKKSVEDIGQEDAWFKQNVDSNKVEVVNVDDYLILCHFSLKSI